MADFFIENKIYYHDTDAGGIVYYADYFKHLEESRYAYCLQRGVDLAVLMKKGLYFPVVHTQVEYKASARYADTIRIYARIEKIGSASIHFHQEIFRDTTLLVAAKTVWACIDSEFHACPLPADIKQALL